MKVLIKIAVLLIVVLLISSIPVAIFGGLVGFLFNALLTIVGVTISTIGIVLGMLLWKAVRFCMRRMGTKNKL